MRFVRRDARGYGAKRQAGHLGRRIGSAAVGAISVLAMTATPSAAFLPSFFRLPGSVDPFESLLLMYLLLDPQVTYRSSSHDPWRSDIGGFAEPAGQETDTVTAMTWAAQDVSQYFGLSGAEQLVVGVQYTRSWSDTDHILHFPGAAPFVVAKQETDQNSLGANFGYVNGAWYASGVAGYMWGDGKLTDALGDSGKFDTDGFFAAAELGRVFTLSGESYTSQTPVTVKTSSFYIDPAIRIARVDTTAEAYVDDAGFAYGEEEQSYWSVGASLRLFALLPQDGIVYSPFVKLSVDQWVDYEATIESPAAGQTFNLSQDETFGKVEAGLNVLVGDRAMFGVSGFYGGSGDVEDAGVRAILQVDLFGQRRGDDPAPLR